MKQDVKFIKFIFILSVALIALIVFFINAAYGSSGLDHFTLLAQSFLKGRLDFLVYPGWSDVIVYNGKYYWPLGPFPAILQLPFVGLFSYFGLLFFQSYLHYPFVFLVFYIIYKIARLIKIKPFDSLVFAYAFCFSSVFLGTIVFPWSWNFAHVLVVFFQFYIIYEYLTKKRIWLIGVLLGFTLLTRVPASLFVVFFLIEIIFVTKGKLRLKLVKLFELVFPLTMAAFVLASYNYFRFGNIFEQGYKFANLQHYFNQVRSYGLFSIIHIPGNLYYMFLNLPKPVFLLTTPPVLKPPFIKADPWGMSIFMTSPYLLKLFFFNYKDWLSKLMLFSVFIISIPILLFFGVGFRQFGYRYSLDFLPILYFLFMRKFHEEKKEISSNFKLLIILWPFINFLLYVTIYLNI